MFGTLRYDAQNDDTHFIERTTDPLNGKGEGQRPRYSACDKCRAKKQRCGGRRDGCERCIRTSSECVYSLQGKGRGRRKRNVTKDKVFSIGDSALDAVKPSTANKPQQPAPAEFTQKIEDFEDDTMGSFRPVNTLENDILTPGLIQSDMLPGFDGRTIDDYLDSNYISTLSSQQDFDPDFYFASHCESLESTPVDSLSDISSVFEQAQLLPSPSDFDLNSYVSRSPLSPLHSFSDGLPSPQSTPQARPATPSSKVHLNKDGPATVMQDNCRCLSIMVILLEDLETKARHVDTAALDSILVSQKEALGRCNSVLDCSTCFLRSEYVLLLGMVTERLASLCESTVAKYLDDVTDGTPVRESSADGKHHARENPMDDIKVCLGGYEIETPDERVGLVRMLIVMQLQSLRKFMRKFIEGVATAVASRREGKTQVLKVQAAEQRLARLMQSIRESSKT